MINSREEEKDDDANAREREEGEEELVCWAIVFLQDVLRWPTLPLLYHCSLGKAEKKKESRRTEKKESIGEVGTLSERICCTVSRHQCCRAKKTDNLMEMGKMITNSKDNRSVLKERRKKENPCSTSQLLNQSIDQCVCEWFFLICLFSHLNSSLHLSYTYRPIESSSSSPIRIINHTTIVNNNQHSIGDRPKGYY